MAFLLQPGLGFRPGPSEDAAEHRRRLRAYLWQKSGGLCALCTVPMEPAEVCADHIIPKSKGGPDTIDNLQSAHGSCNSRKNDRSNAEAIALIRHGVPYRRHMRPIAPRAECATASVSHWVRKPGLLTIPEIATELRCRESLIVTMVRTGRLAATDRNGEWVIDRDEVERFIDERSNQHMARLKKNRRDP